MEEMKAGLTSAGQAALVARREAEQAKKAADAAGDGTGEHVTQVFREILGLAAKGRPRTLQKAEDEAPPEPREPRHGFDDETSPMAVIGIDGKFKELNPSFCRLVGYQEHEFAKAAWPSPHDRQLLRPAAGAVLRAGLRRAGIRARAEHLHARAGADGPGRRGDHRREG